MEDYNAEIGKWLKEQRELKKRTQQEVADYFGKTKTAVSYWENGKRPMTAETLMRYCAYLGVDAQNLVRWLAEENDEYANLQRRSPKNMVR